MLLNLYTAIVTLVLASRVSCSALTFILGAQEQQCYYVFTTRPNTQIGYYFAVQSGGAFDVDYTISNPEGTTVISDEKQRQGDFTFNADKVGEYKFCFSNGMLTFAEKVVDFEIKLEDEDSAQAQLRAKMPVLVNLEPIEHVEQMKQTIDKISSQLDGLARTLQYYKTRSNRNQATVRSTESRIYYFSILEVLLMVGMAGLQIVVVQLFFKGLRKQLV